MRRSSMLPVSTAALVLAALAPAARAQSSTRYYVCTTRDFSKRVGYVSPVFAGGPDFQAVGKAWGALMTSKYGITALNYYPCSQGGYATAEQAQTMRDQFLTFMHDQMKQTTVDVDWTYAGAPALAARSPGATGGSAATSAQAASTAASTPARPAVLTAAQRAQAQAQAASSRGWCQYNMHELRTLFDCDCFAQAVLKHQLAHPEEWRTDRDHPNPEPPSAHDLLAGIPFRVDCAECMTDQRIAAYVKEMMSQSNAPGATIQARIDKSAACVATNFARLIKAEPYADAVGRIYNNAQIACAGGRP